MHSGPKQFFLPCLGIALILLARILERPATTDSLIEDAQVTGFGNVIAGLLIVSLGTTIDFAELRRQWKVVRHRPILCLRRGRCDYFNWYAA